MTPMSQGKNEPSSQLRVYVIENKTKKVPFRMTPERHKEVKKLLADREQTFQDILEEGLALAIKGQSEDSMKEPLRNNTYVSRVNQPYNMADPETQTLVDTLVKILKSGHVAAKNAVRSNLIAFNELVDSDLERGEWIRAESGRDRETKREPTREEVAAASRFAQSYRKHSLASGESRHPRKGDSSKKD